MAYSFRVTHKASEDLYIEDRGYAHEVKRGDPDFAILEAEFANLLEPGQTAQCATHGDGGWDVVDGFPLLDDLRGKKRDSLKAAFMEAEAHGVVMVKAGFAIDATERANRDINGLITRLEATGQQKASFCAADNSFHEVSLDDLRGMLLAIISHAQNLYARKWELRQAIDKAATPSELEAIEISFAEVL